MSEILLIHDAWHGAWCWEKVRTRLEADGHAVHSPDLPGHGDLYPHLDAADATFDGYLQYILVLLATCAGPAVLVGHGLAAALVVAAAVRAPEKVERLCLVAGVLPAPGATLMSRLLENPSNALRDRLEILDGRLQLPERLPRTAFYHDCAAEDAERGARLLRPEPVAPLHTPVNLDRARLAQLPVTYIECIEDQAVHIAQQRRMAEDFQCNPVITLHTGHAPYFSAPAALAAALAATGIEREEG